MWSKAIVQERERVLPSKAGPPQSQAKFFALPCPDPDAAAHEVIQRREGRVAPSLLVGHPSCPVEGMGTDWLAVGERRVLEACDA